MKRSIILLLAASAALLLSVASCKCSRGTETEEISTVTDSLRTAWIDTEYDKVIKHPFSVEIRLEMEYIDDDRLPKSVQDRFNANIIEACLGETYVNLPPEEAAASKCSDIEAGFLEDVIEDDGEDSITTLAEWQLSGQLSYDAPEGYLVYYISAYDYNFGAAHGYYYLAPIVLDQKTGDRIHEKDLFNDDYEPLLQELLEKHIEDAEDFDPDFLLVDAILPNDNFDLTTEGITYYFNPYEIAPFVAGIIEISIPWEELKPVLKQQS